jgi:hypothetical protein
MDIFNSDKTYWDRLKGYVTENRIDSRFILRDKYTEEPYGSLRIVSHPDLPPGQLRTIFYYVVKKEKKTDHEILKTIEDYQLDITDLEIFSIDENIETEKIIHIDYINKIEELFNVKVIERK